MFQSTFSIIFSGRKRTFYPLISSLSLTDEAENVPDGGDEDDQHVVEGQDGGGDQHVASPAKVASAEQQRGDGGANLGARGGGGGRGFTGLD